MPRALQVAGLTAFCTGLAAVAVATCVLSYAGLHALAAAGGIPARYARGYPLLIDALLVIVLAAVLTLRDAGLPSRILSWVTLLVLLGADAGGEALHASGRTLPRGAAAITVAVLPWLLVLVTFVLLLAMLRHVGRDRDRRQPPRSPSEPLPVRTPLPRNHASILPGMSARLVSGAAAGAAAAETESRGPGGSSSPPAMPNRREERRPADPNRRDDGASPPAPERGDRGPPAPG